MWLTEFVHYAIKDNTKKMVYAKIAVVGRCMTYNIRNVFVMRHKIFIGTMFNAFFVTTPTIGVSEI